MKPNEEFPCENCISLAICLIKYNKFKFTSDLTKQCSILSNYIYEDETFITDNISTTRKFFEELSNGMPL